MQSSPRKLFTPRLPVTTEMGALFSPCEKYRYKLWRIWDKKKEAIMFLMLNPSTASHTMDDPTVAKCTRYAIAWGYGAIYVGNLFAFRTPFPVRLFQQEHPVSDPEDPEANDVSIQDMVYEATTAIGAWGTGGTYQQRGDKVREKYKDQLYCLAHTQKGEPNHPLYLKKDLKPFLLT